MEHIVYVFDGFHLDVTRRKLSSAGGVVQPVNSRAMDALLVLVAHAGEVIDKRRLMQAVWPAAVVEDNNLNQCIASIRRALGETAGTNRYIMTVPGRGYCFVSPVSAVTCESVTPVMQTPPRRHSGAAWIVIGTVTATAALLLWMGMQRDPGQDRVRAGADTTADEGADAGHIVVRLRPVNAAHDGHVVAAALSACLLQRPDLHLQIDVRLVDSSSRAPVWSGQFLGGADDIVPQQAQDSRGDDACGHLTAHE